MHRALWRCPAIMRTVRRGAPGIGTSQSSAGRCSTRYAVTRLLVRQEARRVAPRSACGVIAGAFFAKCKTAKTRFSLSSLQLRKPGGLRLLQRGAKCLLKTRTNHVECVVAPTGSKKGEPPAR